MIRLKKFDREDHAVLIRWIDSEEMLIPIAGRQMAFPVTEAQLDILIPFFSSLSPVKIAC